MSTALDSINHLLSIDAGFTFKGDEVKCWTPDEEGGRSKMYLDAKNCDLLAAAFAVLAAELRSGVHAAPPNGDGTEKET